MPARKDSSKSCCDEAARNRLANVARAAREAWSSRPEVALVLDELTAYGEGAALDRCPRLGNLVSSPIVAQGFVSGWLHSTCALLARHPLAQCDFDYQLSNHTSVFQIAKVSSAELALLAHEPFDPADSKPATTAQFAAVDRHEICLGGRADIACATRPSGHSTKQISLFRRSMAKGDRITLLGPSQAKLFEKIESRFIVLRLSRAAKKPAPVQDVRISDGGLVRQASGDMASSNREIAMTLLARMKRVDAVPTLARMAREGDEHLRWEAMRHCLSLDTAEGFKVLAEMGAAPGDPLAGPAAALRSRLEQAYPQLRNWEAGQCPA